jgi:hypothetical protein
MALNPTQIQQLIDALEKQGGAVGTLKLRLEELSAQQLDAVQQAAALISASDAVTDALNRQEEANMRLTNSLEDQRQKAEEELAVQIDIAAMAEKQTELDEILIDQLENKLRLQQDLTGRERDQIDNLKKAIDQRKKELPQLKKTSEAMKGLGTNISKMLSGSAPDINSVMNPKNISNLKNMFQTFKKDPAAMKVALKGMMKAAGMKAIAMLAMEIGKLAKELGDTENAFMRATNSSRDFARNITLTYREGRKFAMAAKDMTAAAVSLTTTFTDFTFLAPDAQREITTATAALNKMGMSNSNTAQTMQLLTKSFGMTGKEGVKTLANLEKFAENLQVPLSKLSADYIAAGDSLSKLGDNGDDAFRRLAKITKVTGLEMNKLLNIVNQFDTFEGAARQAGKLNAALGGNFVNAMDLMMETDPAARFEQIRSAILDSGLSFKEMSYYQRNFYKDALGLQSVADLAQVLSGDMSAVTDETMKSEQELLALKEQARVTASFQEQLNAVFAQMIPILTPVIDLISNVISGLNTMAPVLKVIGGALIGFFVGGGPIGAAIGALAMLFDTIEVGNTGMSFLEVILQEVGAAWSNLFTAFSPFVDMWSSWMPDLAEDSIVFDGLALGLKALAKGFSGMTNVLALVVNSIAVVATAFNGLVTGNWEPFQKSLANFGNTVRKIIEPFMMLANFVGLIDDKFTAFGFTLFEKQYASNMVDGIEKMGSVITGVGNAAAYMGDKISAASDWVSGIADDWFGDDEKSLTVTPALKEASEVAQKAASVSTSNVVARTTSSDGATDSVVNDFKNELVSLKNAQASGGALDSNREQTLVVNMHVDREKFASIVQKINGEEALRDISSRNV